MPHNRLHGAKQTDLHSIRYFSRENSTTIAFQLRNKDHV